MDASYIRYPWIRQYGKKKMRGWDERVPSKNAIFSAAGDAWTYPGPLFRFVALRIKLSLAVKSVIYKAYISRHAGTSRMRKKVNCKSMYRMGWNWGTISREEKKIRITAALGWVLGFCVYMCVLKLLHAGAGDERGRDLSNLVREHLPLAMRIDWNYDEYLLSCTTQARA